MKYLVLFFWGVLFSLTFYGQKNLSDLDSTNYKKLLLNIENVDEKLIQKFSKLEFKELVNLIGTDFEIYNNGNSRIIRNKKQLKKKNIKAVFYELNTINFDNTSSHPHYLVVVLKKKVIKDIYTSSIGIRWAR